MESLFGFHTRSDPILPTYPPRLASHQIHIVGKHVSVNRLQQKMVISLSSALSSNPSSCPIQPPNPFQIHMVVLTFEDTVSIVAQPRYPIAEPPTLECNLRWYML